MEEKIINQRIKEPLQSVITLHLWNEARICEKSIMNSL